MKFKTELYLIMIYGFCKAMHGVGYSFSQECFRVFGLKPFIPVKQQVDPDPDFPTVKFPNPEGYFLAVQFSRFRIYACLSIIIHLFKQVSGD